MQSAVQIQRAVAASHTQSDGRQALIGTHT
jgi:hypothetical protein